MGGQAWGGHTCPDLPPYHVRSRQRPEIIARAKAVRNPPPPPPPPPAWQAQALALATELSVLLGQHQAA